MPDQAGWQIFPSGYLRGGDRVAILEFAKRTPENKTTNLLNCLMKWSEREDLNLRPLVSQTSALTGLRHAPMPFH